MATDFFERRKDYYKNERKEVRDEIVRILPVNICEEGDLGIKLVASAKENKKKQTFFRYSNIKLLKWEHIEDKVLGEYKVGKYGDKLLKKGCYILKGFIPDKYKRPILKYYETEDKFTIKCRGSNTEHKINSSMCFSFKRGKFRIYDIFEYEGKKHICGRNVIPKNILTHFDTEFFNNCNLVCNMEMVNILEATGSSIFFKFDFNNDSKLIIRHIGETLIRKAYENGVIDKSAYRVLKKGFEIVWREYNRKVNNLLVGSEENTLAVSRMYGDGLLHGLAIHLMYGPHLSLLKMCGSKFEYIDHWDKLIAQKASGYGKNAFREYEYIGRLFRKTGDLDEVVKKLTGFENKGAIKKIAYELIYTGKYSLLEAIRLSKGYLKRDWLIELDRITCNDKSRYTLNLENKMRKKLCQFMKDYLETDKLVREFICLFFIGRTDFKINPEVYANIFTGGRPMSTNQMNSVELFDMINMYYLLPIEFRPRRLSIKKLHDRLSEIHNRNRGLFRQNTIMELVDSYEYDYFKGDFGGLMRLDGDKVGKYNICVPKMAGEIRNGGVELNNCLTTYVYHVHSGISFIMYLMEGDIKRYAIEIINRKQTGAFIPSDFLNRDGKCIISKSIEYVVNQFYGERNSMASEEDFNLFKEYILPKLKEISDEYNLEGRDKGFITELEVKEVEEVDF
jgi:hypothetical protein